MKVVIVAKTRMGSGACIGALSFEGRSLRLIAPDWETNDHFNQEYQVGEVWEIETQPDPDIISPHVENVFVTGKRRLGPMMQVETFIEHHMPSLSGGPAMIFEGLAGTTSAGALYITERLGLPGRSTMFWRPDRTLVRDDDQKRIRYRYPTPEGGPTLTFTGFQEPIPEIPANSLVRVSLAHWWRPREMPEGELRCYVQLSGWFLDGFTHHATPEPAAQEGKEPCEEHIPELEQVLQQVFGYAAFKPLQVEIIRNVLCKRDTLAIMPTGSGKSLCFQLPATLFPGLTVVVSPLISLMEDQVLELKEWGIPAVFLNSTLSHSEYVQTAANIRAGEVRLLYAAPETLLRPETIVLLDHCRVDCLVIDEAHCISEWGHDFRPEYRQLAGLRARLPQAVTLAVTATATQRVRRDIQKSLGITDANQFMSSFDRPNLVISVVDKVSGLAQARAFLDAHVGQAGIVYCATRKQVDALAAQLGADGYPVLPYHAGMEDGERRSAQRCFRYEDGLIMVATIAFGMGINKSNVRFILHFDLPKNIENYYQQIGRAGRDGLPADCQVLFSYGDIATIRYFIEQGAPELQRGARQRLQSLLDFLEARTCRRIPLLAYFGEKFAPGKCQACDNCLASIRETSSTSATSARGEIAAGMGAVPAEAAPGYLSAGKVDLTVPARQLIACAQESGEIFGIAHLIDVLRGSKRQKVVKFKHDGLKSHGVGRFYSKEHWRHLAVQFIQQGLLERTQPHGSIKVTAAGKAVLEGGEVWSSLPGDYPGVAAPVRQEHDPLLFDQLRALRLRLASERSLPPYVICHDRSLVEMATYLPRTPESLGRIYGIGQHKVAAYGPAFLALIQAYCQEHDIQERGSPGPQTTQVAAPKSRTRTDDVWQRFQAGESLQQLATGMGLVQSTILGHLKKAFETGKPLRVAGLQAASHLSPSEIERVQAAFADLGTDYLRPVFEACGEQIPYEELHLWRLIFLATPFHHP